MSPSPLKSSLIVIAVIVSFVSACMPSIANAQQIKSTSIHQKLAELEASSGGRIGISAINTANHRRIQYRSEERFPFCSTSKVMVVAAILKKSMTNHHLLQQKITYTQNDIDLSDYAPVTKNHVKDEMSIDELCAAAIIYSDNGAMNLLMKELGGPEVVTHFARSIGDDIFRLDRWEPDLNSAIPGDLRDTSTPLAMEQSLQQLAFRDVLSLPKREQLQAWLKNNTTGNTRIRSGVPNGWLVGDKTGTGDYGTTNDIGIIYPPKCPPIVVAIYFTHNTKDAAPSNELIASATRLLINEFARTDQCIRQYIFL